MARDVASFTVLQLTGDEAEARVFAESELERLARQLDDEPVSPQAQASVYTAHLFPFGGPDYAVGDEDAPVQVHFPYGDPQLLAATLRRETEHLYATGGAERAGHLERGIFLPSKLRSLQGSGPPALRHYPNIVPFASLEEDQAACDTVLAAWRAAHREVLAEAAAELPKVQERAVKLAQDQLGAAREQIRAEAAKYLTLGQAGANPERVLDPSLPEYQVILRGPKLAALVGALRQVHTRRDALYQAVERQEKARLAGQPLGPVTIEVEGAAADLALLLSVQALEFPVLHRIWNTAALPASVQAVPDTTTGIPVLVGQDAAGRSAIQQLRRALVTSLRTAWQANAAFTAAIGAHPDHVWRYPPLVGRTLDTLQISDPSIAYRAAQDRLEDENGLTLLGALSLGHAALSLGATVAAAAPPVLVALAIVGAALSTVDLILDYMKRREQEVAFNAVLDPSLSVASEPGYWGLLMGVAFAVLDIKGVRDAFVALRAAGAAHIASDLMDVVIP